MQHADEEENGGPLQEVPLLTLEHVPIDAEYLELMTRILTQHGASLTEMDEHPPATMKGHPKLYEVTFPPGTTRANGLVMMRSVPFTLYFPDNYHMQGSELWPVNRSLGDTCINVLYLKKAEAATNDLSGKRSEAGSGWDEPGSSQPLPASERFVYSSCREKQDLRSTRESEDPASSIFIRGQAEPFYQPSPQPQPQSQQPPQLLQPQPYPPQRVP